MEKLNEDHVFELQAEICKTMADAKRLKIIHELRQGEVSVGELSQNLGFSQSNTSQHLAILRRRGLIISRREGTSVYYSLASTRIAEACDMVHSMLLEQLTDNQTLAGMLGWAPNKK